MLKLSGLDALFTSVGNIYLGLMLAGVCLALWKGKTWPRKLVYAALVLTLFIAPVAPGIYRAFEYQNRVETARAMFAERCKKSGEFIRRTVDYVDGIYLLKVRPDDMNYGEQFKLDDPYGRDLAGDGYIRSFLRGSHNDGKPTSGRPTGVPLREGYSFVEAEDRKSGKRFRYTGRVEEPWRTDKSYLPGYTRFAMNSAPAAGAVPRYAVTYDDISTHEEREYWIAGSSLKVIDLDSKEVIAERIGYMVDWAQGSQAGHRSPWLFAADNACPDFLRNFAVQHDKTGPAFPSQIYQTLDFVQKVLKPAK